MIIKLSCGIVKINKRGCFRRMLDVVSLNF
nr:MAG TPA: hypothetical protein [Caudoviricetes sp.]